MSDIFMKGTEPIGQVSDLTADNVEYSSGVSVKDKIDGNNITVIELNQSNFYWTTTSISSGQFLSRASMSQLIGNRTYIGAMVSDDYYGGVISIGYSSTLDKFYVYGFEYDPSNSSITPLHSASTFKVRILAKG